MSVDPSVELHRQVLPQWVTPLKLAAQGTTLMGIVPPDRMLRLSESVVSLNQPVSVTLEFYCDESGYRVVSGKVSTQARFVCQRCLQEMEQDISATVGWVVVLDEEKIESLPKRYEPWILDDVEGDLHSVVEEELLLALPIVSYHELDRCEGRSFFSTNVLAGEVEVTKRPNPFDILKDLKLGK